MIILYNARIYNLDSEHPAATAIAIDQERILALGDETLLELHGITETVDLGGRPVIPGLTDAHIHLEHYALGLQKVDCETATLAECLRRVAGRARGMPPLEWVLGHGWNHNNWTDIPSPAGEGGREPGYGSAADLDAAAPENPVYLTAKSLHAGWANTAALRLAGINGATPDPEGGRIGRDASGKPNGILYEAAMELIGNVLPRPSAAGVADAIRAAQPILWQMGLTGVHDFDRQRCFAALQGLQAQGDLRLRVIKSIPLDLLPQAVELGLRTGFGDDFLRIGAVKAFSDGALGPQTAAMLQSYEGKSGKERGMLFLDAEELFERGSLAVENGLSLAVHAIGDRANHEVLDGIEELRRFEQDLNQTEDRRPKTVEPSGPRSSVHGRLLRHRIEHVQLLHPDDAARLAALGVIASMQPIHAISDMEMADHYWGKRAGLSYAWRTQLAHGAALAFGSDAPVESPNPFWGLHAAVTRRRLDGTPGSEGWYPEQRLTVLEALQAFTTGAAYAAGMEDRLGKLAPGFLADLLVLDTDPFTCEPDELYAIHPIGTMVGGDWVRREF